MKRLKYYILSIIAAIVAIVTLSSCGKEKMETPQNLIVDVNNKLSWDPIENAKSYVIHIKGVSIEYDDEIYSRKANYSLEKLEPGDYVIEVKSVSSEENILESSWSESYSFTRLYESGCVYTLINNQTEYEITRAGSASGDVIIEPEYRGLPVTSIADYAFKGAGRIETITLPNTIKTIGNGAFYNCTGLTSITLPESVTEIGDAAFQTCRSLTEITIPSKVERIGTEAFLYCRNLTTIHLPSTLKYIGEKAFSNCLALKEFIVPEGVTYIGPDAFSANTALETFTFNKKLTYIQSQTFYKDIALKNVIIPSDSNLSGIGVQAFAECSLLNNVVLPGSLRTIESGAFYGDISLDTITVPDTVEEIGQGTFALTKLIEDAKAANEKFVYASNWVIYYNKNAGSLERIDKTTFKDGTVGISDAVFNGIAELTRVDLASSLRYIGNYTFYNCPKLYRFTIQSNSVKSLGAACFANDIVLQTVTLREGLERIGSSCFSGCTVLKNNDLADTPLIPESVTSIGRNAFYETKIYSDAASGNLYYAGNWLVGVKNIDAMPASIEIKEDTRGIADYVFYKSALSNIQGLYNVSYIGKGTFYKCADLQSIVLNKNLKEIPDYAFYGCKALFNVTFPQNLRSLGQYSFGLCERLDEVDLSKTKITEIKDGTFYKCINLAVVKLPNTITRLGERSFYKCTYMESFTMPDSVIELGAMAFYGCEYLSEIHFSEKLEVIPEFAFGDCGFKELVIPSTVKEIGDSAFYGNHYLEAITFSEGVEKIGDYSFHSNSGLTTLTFPSTMKSIGKYSFAKCGALRQVILTDTIEEIKAHVFYKCNVLTIYATTEKNNEGWSNILNSTSRPIIYNCTLDATKSYVVSITVKKVIDDFVVVDDETGAMEYLATDPVRDGYTFMGYKATITDEEGNTSEVIYQSNELNKVEEGTVLTTIWQKAESSEVENEEN